MSACGGESGYLTCAKLIRSLPGVRVVMVGPESKRYARFAKFVGAVAYLAERANHHPDVSISWNKVTLTLSTHSAGGLTLADFNLARQISALV